MKKFYTFMLAVLLSCITMQAQEADYQPLVREGVRWVCMEEYPVVDYTDSSGISHNRILKRFYSLQFRGDTLIDGKVYKKLYREFIEGDSLTVFVPSENRYVYASSLVYSDTEPISYLREDNKRVYCKPVNSNHEDAIFIHTPDYVEFPHPYIETAEYIEYVYTEQIVIDGKPCRVYKDDNGAIFIEGIGFVSKSDGDFISCADVAMASNLYIYGNNIGLVHVEDLTGRIIYKAPWYEEPTTCMPLVREGVVWQYAYCIFVSEAVGAYTKVLNIQFKGDTIMNGVNYKKCYLYDSEELPANSLPVYYARENNGKVMFANPRHEVIDTIGTDAFMPEIPGDLFEENGETVVYDFGDMPNFAEKIYAVIESTSEVEVNGMPAKKYHLSTEGTYGFDYVEGVGVDGERSGVLFLPFVLLSTGYVSNPSGLIRLADLDGNTLYEGAYYSTFYGNKYDVNHDGMVDIADINILINVMLGYDVPIGNQGHDTMPAEDAEKIMDVTGDSHVDITDVNTLINKMLGE